tara:strand:- start:4654 stop:5187 length:534 start_codon:yes stop_codon:yes gene_type:complete
MAHGKIRVNTLTYDTGSGDVDVAVSTLGARRTDSEINTLSDARITAATGVSVQAYDANNALKDVAQTYTAAQRGDIVDVTGTTPSFDLNAGNNFKFTTSGNWTSFTLTNLATAAEGQTGSIFIVYGGAHSGPVAGSMKFVGGSSSITLTSTATKIDRIDYIVLNSTTLTCNFTANYE